MSQSTQNFSWFSESAVASIIYDLAKVRRHEEVGAFILTVKTTLNRNIDLNQILEVIMQKNAFVEAAPHYMRMLMLLRGQTEKDRENVYQHGCQFSLYLSEMMKYETNGTPLGSIFDADVNVLRSPALTEEYQNSLFEYPEGCLYPLWLERFRVLAEAGNWQSALPFAMAIFTLSLDAKDSWRDENFGEFFTMKKKPPFPPQNLIAGKYNHLNHTPLIDLVTFVSRKIKKQNDISLFKSLVNTLDPHAFAMAVSYAIQKSFKLEKLQSIQVPYFMQRERSFGEFFVENQPFIQPCIPPLENAGSFADFLADLPDDQFNVLMNLRLPYKPIGISPFQKYYSQLMVLVKAEVKWKKESSVTSVTQEIEIVQLNKAETKSLKNRENRRLVSTYFQYNNREPLFTWKDDPHHLFRGPYAEYPHYFDIRMELFRLYEVADRVVEHEVIVDDENYFWVRTPNLSPRPTTEWHKIRAGFDSYNHGRVDPLMNGINTLAKVSDEEYAAFFTDEDNLMALMIKLVFNMGTTAAFRGCLQNPNDPRKIILTDIALPPHSEDAMIDNVDLKVCLITHTQWKRTHRLVMAKTIALPEVKSMIGNVVKRIREKLELAKLLFQNGVPGSENVERYLSIIENQI